MTLVSVRVLDADAAERSCAALGAILAECITENGSLGYLRPYGPADGTAFYEKVAASVRAGDTVLLAAFDDTGIVGTAQLGIAQKPNQIHRADVMKVLVPRGARGRGVGRALMAAVEAEARRAGRSLLVLDTARDSSGDRLYRNLGWTLTGVVPGYAADAGGRLLDCCFYHKVLPA